MLLFSACLNRVGSRVCVYVYMRVCVCVCVCVCAICARYSDAFEGTQFTLYIEHIFFVYI